MFVPSRGCLFEAGDVYRPGCEERVSGDISLVKDTEEICISMCREYHLNEKQEEAVVALINSIKHGTWH